MSEKRFRVCIDDNNGVGLLDNSVRLLFFKFSNKEDAVTCEGALKYLCDLMNELHEENEQLRQFINKGRRLSVKELMNNINENESLKKKIKDLQEENEELRQKKHWVYVDVDNANGCMNCKYDKGSICSILDCGTHDYLDGVSECGLKYWEYKDE